MADIKTAKDTITDNADMAEAYTAKVNLAEHELELEQAKLDMYMGPTLWFMYILAYIDRQNIGNAKVAGMGADLNLNDDFCEVPSNMILTRSRPSWYLPGIMIIWGAICAVMSVVKNYQGMLALRFFLGCIEAGFFPGVLYVMTCWYKKAEIGKRFSIFYTASVCSGAMSGLLAGAITGNMEGVRGMRGWRWLYLIEGVCTIGFAIGLKFILLDFPETTKRFSLEERQLAVVRMIHDRNTTAARHGQSLTHWQSLKAALADPRTYIFMVLFTMDLGSCTISYFIPTIVKQMGYTSVMAQYMTIPIWMVGAVFLVVLSCTADKTRDRRWHITGCMGLSFVCTIVCVTVSNPKVVYAMLCFYIAVVVALVNSVGNLSAVYGSRLWPSTDGPRFVKGFATTGAFTGFGTILAALIPIIFSYLPKEGRTKAEREILEREREFVENRVPGEV
ncbi:vitamin H transporter [Colletotrichum kahawae]|uniref:Vitamin H transporter n=1 Tax=Colletotrichum kahawae TaxID=34407 RepID=A0AAE0D4D8_COLKA|nr:vitamin H transporter [Colletotrichum kahawae]